MPHSLRVEMAIESSHRTAAQPLVDRNIAQGLVTDSYRLRLKIALQQGQTGDNLCKRILAFNHTVLI